MGYCWILSCLFLYILRYLMIVAEEVKVAMRPVLEVLSSS